MKGKKRPGRPRERELGPFGRRLRELIEQSGRFENRAAFLRELGIPAPTMYRYETGERPPPAPLVAQMARALRVSADELLGVPPATKDRDLLVPAAELHRVAAEYQREVDAYFRDEGMDADEEIGGVSRRLRELLAK